MSGSGSPMTTHQAEEDFRPTDRSRRPEPGRSKKPLLIGAVAAVAVIAVAVAAVLMMGGGDEKGGGAQATVDRKSVV